MAPVLVLPRVFEPEFCAQVIRLWEKGDHKDSGVSSRYGNVNVSHLKQTEDYTVAEPMMQKAISDRLAYRIGPELTKVFAFDRQFAFDSHVVLSYSAEGRHFFGAHRDNGAPTTADRAFALSLNLNDDFDGGELVFPEYAGIKVSPPAGAAAVFSCSILHQALPVTRGRRFVLTTFFRAKPSSARRRSCRRCSWPRSSSVRRQRPLAHMEACTAWGLAGSEFGTRNSCDRPVSILFMALGDRRIVERDVAPGAWFGRGCRSSQRLDVRRLPGGLRAQCPVRGGEQGRHSGQPLQLPAGTSRRLSAAFYLPALDFARRRGRGRVRPAPRRSPDRGRRSAPPH